MRESILKFVNYTVEKMIFEAHACEKTDAPIEIKQNISKRISMKENGCFDASLAFKTVPQEDVIYPFDIEVVVTGHFQIENNVEEDIETIDGIVNQNSFAILFPYLRSIITNLTATANIPPIILPILNLTI